MHLVPIATVKSIDYLEFLPFFVFQVQFIDG